MKKKNLLICVVLTLACMIVSCNSDNETHEHIFDQKNVSVTYLKSEATCTSASSYYYSCKCGKKSDKTFTDGDVASHVFDQKIVSDTYLQAEATCTSASSYYYSCKCGEKSTETFTDGDVASHIFDQKNTSADFLQSEATCTSASVYYYSCKCGEKSTEMFTDGDVACHIFDQKFLSDKYIRSTATCVSAATYFYACECGELGTDSYTHGEPSPHQYKTSVINASCNTEGYTMHLCECGASYKDNITPKTYEHNFVYGTVTKNGFTYGIDICTICSLEVEEWGNADGTHPQINRNVKYYVTGNHLENKEYEIVIYGKGAMPDFTDQHLPLWHKYLCYTKKITIAEGITSIGAYTFYDPNSTNKVTYSIPDTVKTIKSHGLGMYTSYIELGKSVTRIEDFGILYERVSGYVYIPKTVTYMGDVLNAFFVYEGDVQDLYKIKTNAWNQTMTLKRYFSLSLNLDPYPENYKFYLNAKNINDRTERWYP